MSDSYSLRAEVARLNADALVALMAEHGITIPAREVANWRPTKRTHGHLNGLNLSVTPLCTNGVVAYFLVSDGRVLYGHNSNFDGKVETLPPPPSLCKSRAKPDKPTESRRDRPKNPKKRSSAASISTDSIAAAMKLLLAAAEALNGGDSAAPRQ